MNCRKTIGIIQWLCLMPLLVAGQDMISSESLSQDTLLLKLTFPQPGLTDLASGQLSESKQFVLPDVSETLVILSGDPYIEVTIRTLEEKVISADSPILPVDDISIGDEEKGILGYKIRKLSDRKWELETLNGLNGTKIFLLRIYPWNLHPSRMQIRWIKQAVFQVVGKDVRIAPGNAIPADFLSYRATRESPPLSNPQLFLPSVSIELFSQETFPPLKIEADYEGIMTISQKRIAEAGWEVDHVNPRFLRVVGKGGEIPIRVTGESDGSFDDTDGVEFWVEPLWDRSKPGEIRLDVFAEKNVYWLELGNTDGLRMAQEEGAVPGSQHETVAYPRSYPFSLHVEQDASFHRLPYAVDVDQGDYWFYSGPITGGEKRSYNFILHDPDNYAPQPVVVRIKLRGQSTSSLSHPFEIYVNDIRVGSGAWQGNEAVVMDGLAFSSAYLKEGENDLVVVNQSQEGVLAQLMLDWFEVSYPRFYTAYDNYLRFRAPEYSLGKVCRFQIDGFTHDQIEVYKKGISRIFGQEIEAVEDSTGAVTYRVRFEDFVVDEKTEYIVLALQKKRIPDALIQVRIPTLRSSNRGASYVMIVACDSLLNESLGELIQQRQSQGLQVEVVPLQSIYDEFNHGIPNPSAIRQFLQYTYRFWIPSPRSVLLVGDGYINCRAEANQGNLIPVVLYQTSKYGASASDHWYTLLDGEDAIPEIAIGRLPVRNQKELKHVVDKILQYERSPPGPWNNRYLLIGAGGSDDVFRQQSETMIHQIFHPSIHPERLYLTGDISDPYVGGTEDLMRHLREGVFHVNFRGHGGGAIWSDAGLLDLDDVALIENKNKLPFITSMTCFTGDFTSSRMALGEALMLEKDVGCAAFWGSTGLGWLWND
jgi:hypothetical protein